MYPAPDRDGRGRRAAAARSPRPRSRRRAWRGARPPPEDKESFRYKSGEFHKGCKRSNPGGKKHAQTDGKPEAEVVHGDLELLLEVQGVGLGEQFDHNEISRSFGMRFRLVLWNASFAKSLRVSECVERQGHCHLQYNGPMPVLPRSAVGQIDGVALCSSISYHFIGHLSWNWSWLSLTMVATVLSVRLP